ncbi:invasin domain 3-containing protein [Balneolaceae bacterium ANBcel3]|nr:invasin domain 3-containing protein [Balneolaceae bacterium ANBcel3]
MALQTLRKSLLMLSSIIGLLLLISPPPAAADEYTPVLVQSADGDETVSFGQTPQPGNLLVVIGARAGTGQTPVLDGSGWTRRVNEQHGISGISRRSLAVWTKIAGEDEPIEIASNWSGQVRLMAMEYEVPDHFVVEYSGSNSSNNSLIGTTSLNTGLVVMPEEKDYLLIGGFASARASGTVNWNLSGASGPTISGNPSVAFGYGSDQGVGTTGATASWSNSIFATVSLSAFVLQPPPDPGQTQLSASPESIPANGLSESTITVQARNPEGDIIQYGGAEVHLMTTHGTLSPVTDHQNGTYTATLTGTNPGVAVISGTMNGEPIGQTTEVLLTAEPLSVEVVQVAYGTDQGSSEEAVFGQTPQPGNLLVAVSSHRYNRGNPDITGTGWNLHVHEHYPEDNQSDFRRGLAMWTKTAGVGEPDTYSVNWNWSDPGRSSNLILMELALPEEWALSDVQHISNNNEQTASNTLSTGALPTMSGESYLLITGLGARENSGSVEWDGQIDGSFQSLYMDDGEWPITTSVGYGTIIAGDNVSSTATMEQASLANTGLVVFGLIDNSGIAKNTQITANPVVVPSDGESQTTLTVTVLNGQGEPVPDMAVELSQGSGSSVITPAQTHTNSAGLAVFSAVNSNTETVTYSALVNGLPVMASVSVSFSALSPLSLLEFKEINGEIYVIESFDEPGAYDFSFPDGVTEAEILVVGGGGSGGTSLEFVDAGAGGGGAGGLIHQTISVTPGENYLVQTGAGGIAPTEDNTPGQNGENSRFGTMIALGGGGGIGGGPAGGDGFGSDGGSGGGGRGDPGGAGLQPGSESGGFGNRGGNSDGAPTGAPAGGGGGAGSAGGDVSGFSGEQGGQGGAGRELAITGQSIFYAGGGGGGTAQDRNPPGEGGIGGGGTGGNDNIAPTPGVHGLGGGGGGGNNSRPGADGGSGIVIVRYNYNEVASVAAGDPFIPEGSYRAVVADAPVRLKTNDHQTFFVRDNLELKGSAEWILTSEVETDQLFAGNSPEIRIEDSAAMVIQDGAWLDLENFNGSVNTQGEGRIVVESNASYRNRTGQQPMLEVQRFFNEPKGWRMLASPVSADYTSFASDVLVLQGFDASDYPELQPNVLWWDEEVAGTTLEGWQHPQSANEMISPGQGFFVYVFDGAGLPGNESGSYHDTLPFMVSVSGTESSSGTDAFSYDVSYTPREADSNDSGSGEFWRAIPEGMDEGWNLLGNPSASALDWDNREAWNTSNMDEVLYIWDPDTNEYLVRNSNQTGSLPDGRIAPYQSFWVRANGPSPELSFLPDAKTLEHASFYRKEQPLAEIPRIRLKLEAEGMKAHTFFDFSDKASMGIDPNDAWLLPPPSDTFLQLYSVTGEKEKPLVINHLPARSEKPFRIPLGVRGYKNGQPVSGVYRLALDSGTQIPNHWKVELKDHITGEKVNLRATGTHKASIESFRTPAVLPDIRLQPIENVFDAVAGEEDFDESAKKKSYQEKDYPFTLIITPDELKEGEAPLQPYLQQNYPNPFNASTMIRFGVSEEMRVKLELFDIMGRRVQVLVDGQKSAGMYTIPVDARHLASGVYVYRLIYGGNVKTKKMTLIR